jgi:hypothetical protein
MKVGQVTVGRCQENHFFVEDRCPMCGGQRTADYPFWDRDCVACGQLCPAFAYACDSARPLKWSQGKLVREHAPSIT